MLEKLKIIFVSYHNPHFSSITEYCEQAISELMHECVSFDDRRFIFPGRLRQSMSFFHDLDLEIMNASLLKTAFFEKPDICVVTGGYTILPKTVDRLKKQGIKTALWTTDVPHFDSHLTNFYLLRKAAKVYDHVFCGGTEAIELMEDLNLKSINWLPFACAPHYHKPVEITKQDQKMYGSDIVFVGSFYPSRAKILEQIADFDLGIWGPGWEKLDFYSPLKKNIKYAGDIKPELWLKIYAAARLVIAPHYRDGKTVCYQVSPKVYEALACKCTVLVDPQMDIYPNFKHNEHLSIFNDIDQLKDNIRFLLDNPEKAEEIAENGYQEVIQKHTYKHRIAEMIRIITGG